jgi:transcriptional regulator with XRE-family HTH domain
VKRIEELFGLAVRRRREQLGLSQEEFADKAGIHRTYVSSVELGKVQIGISVAQRLADALGVRLSALWREVEQERESRSAK